MNIWAMNATGDHETLQAARVAVFNRIAPAGNWKRAIDTWIKAEDLNECSEAAVWFTGAPLTVIGTSFGMVHVTAPGYYATIGA